MYHRFVKAYLNLFFTKVRTPSHRGSKTGDPSTFMIVSKGFLMVTLTFLLRFAVLNVSS